MLHSGDGDARARAESVCVRRLPGRPVSVKSLNPSPVPRHAAAGTSENTQVAGCRWCNRRSATLSARPMSVGVLQEHQRWLRNAADKHREGVAT